jgi:hypothetical protein
MKPPLGSMPTIEWVHADQLAVDATYQRSTDNETSRRLIRRIANRFDWRLFGVLGVSRRPDDSLVIIDGQHRWSGANLRGDIPQLPCCITRFGSVEEEALFFIEANRQRKAMNRLDDFHAALAAADPNALEIEKLVHEAELTVATTTAQKSWQAGEVAFTSSIARAIRKDGRAIAAKALRLIAEAFPGQVLTHGGSVFTGLVEIIGNPPPSLDEDRLFQALLAFDIDGWGDFVDGLRGGNTRASAMRQAIMEAYKDVKPPEEAYAEAVAA